MFDRLHGPLRECGRNSDRVRFAKLDLGFATTISRIFADDAKAQGGGMLVPRSLLDLAGEAYDVLIEENVPLAEWGV